MPKHSKLLLTALTAAFVLAGAVATASANRLEVSEQRIRVVWSSLRFAERVATGGAEVRCPVTIEGSFHSKTLSKVCGQLVGYITKAILPAGNPPAACTFNNGATNISILTATLPWHILYVSFSGRLPEISRVRLKLLNVSFLLTAFGVSCLYQSTNASPAFGEVILNEATGEVTGLRADETRTIPKKEGSILCPGSGIFEGTGTTTVLGGTAGITVKLVQ